MVTIVDYGVGNLFSLVSSFRAADKDAVVTGDEKLIREAERIILPGVGAFKDASEKLNVTGLGELIKEKAAEGTPLMGVCLGMQLLFDESYEYGIHKGLGLLKGKVTPLAGRIDEKLKIPHMGWNRLEYNGKKHELFKYLGSREYVYFVHSYSVVECGDSLIATASYGEAITAAVARGNVCGCQFHPEKSSETGLKILKAFCEMEA